MFCRSFAVIAVVVLIAGSQSLADRTDPVEEKLPATEPKGVPLELKIINLALEPYDIDPRGEPMYKFQENIIKAEQSGELMHATYVNMILEIRNTGDHDVEIWNNGDATLLDLNLKGNGARSATIKQVAPKVLMPPQAVKIRAGKSVQMPLTYLASGFRNKEKFLYVTEPGLYWLSATFRTGVSPAPKEGAKMLQNGFGEVLLKSVPLQFRAVRPS